MACSCNKKLTNNTSEKITDNKFEKLSLDTPENTIIMAGYGQFTVKQLESEIDANSEIGKKLKSVEDLLDKY